MQIPIIRKSLKITPDSGRVLARFFNNGEQRTVQLVERVINMDKLMMERELENTFHKFSSRHRNVPKILMHHFEKHESLIRRMDFDFSTMSKQQKLLIGSYATMEYSIESAAIFNPSMVQNFDQSFLLPSEKRVILSLRATGEGHLSSIVFRTGILDDKGNLSLSKALNYIDMPKLGRKKFYDKTRFQQKMEEMRIPKEYTSQIMERLPERFEYHD